VGPERGAARRPPPARPYEGRIVLRYIVRRLLWLVLVLVVIVALTYSIFFLLPGGGSDSVAQRFAGKAPTKEIIAEVKRQFGLDQPLYIQFGRFTRNLFLGDQYGWPGLGKSFVERAPLKPILIDRMWVTIQLAVGAAIIWLLVGIPIGVLSALRPRSIFDRFAMTFALIGISMPVFFIGPLALYLFVYQWHILPTPGYHPISEGVGPWFSHFLLPWCVLSLLYAAFYARLSRANLLDVMGEDYMRTARAKGLTERQVIVKHGLRSSLTPLVTVFGLDLAGLLAGAIITETVFNLQGLGYYTIQSVFRLDVYAILDVTIIAAFFITFANLVVDIVYAFLDPRVRYT
jgi:peptide/nickel transport system permease protein